MCGYSLRGLPPQTARCPECGRDPTLTEIASTQAHKLRRDIVIIPVTILVTFVILWLVLGWDALMWHIQKAFIW